MRTIALAAALVSATAARSAWANGAFPATIQVLVPAEAPQTILVATTFGLTWTTDGGASWHWHCEHDQGLQAQAYQLGPPPSSRLFGLGTAGLVTSGDLACSWSIVMDNETAIPLDYFPDPVSADRLLAIGINRTLAHDRSLFELTLGNAATSRATLRPLYTAAMGDDLTTAEIARSNPRIIFTTMVGRAGAGALSARLGRSNDGGATWSVISPLPATADLGIVAIDPEDPEKLFFRVATDLGDQLAVSSDGGKTLATPLAPPGLVFSSFVRLPNGHLLAGWQDIDRGYMYRSIDGGATFTLLPATLHPRFLAARAGQVYAATDIGVDGYALAISDDEGTTWRRLMGFEDVTAGAVCPGIVPACVATCQTVVLQKVFDPAVCAGPVPDAGVDAAAIDPDAASPPDDAGADTQAGPADDDAGCSCRLVDSGGGPGGFAVVLGVAAAFLTIRARARRRAAVTSA
jgi:hypothetical protein